MYRSWAGAFSDSIDVCAIRTPGRETRLREAAVNDLDRLAHETAEAVLPVIDRPYAVFGHSMGAWLGFEVVRRLRQAGAAPPLHLFVSARRAPQTPPNQPNVAHLPDDALIAEMQARYNGIPRAVLDEPDLLALLLPTLRADLLSLETYVFRPAPPLTCDITALGGHADSQVSADDLAAWREQTVGSFHLEQFPGDHYFLLNESGPAVIRRVEQTLTGKT